MNLRTLFYVVVLASLVGLLAAIFLGGPLLDRIEGLIP